MITIGYFHGANKELQDKINIKHGQKFVNQCLTDIIKTILKAKLNIMIIQEFNNKHPYHNYTVWIDNKNFRSK